MDKSDWKFSSERGAAEETAVELQRAFFDRMAPLWRENDALSEDDIEALLSEILLRRGDRVLDVACGAGVLDGVLLRRGVRVDAIDLSPKMIEKALQREDTRGVTYRVADFYRFSEGEDYDCILVFDSYPHFLDKGLFAQKAAALLKEGGMLWIFFDGGREKINGHHASHSGKISVPLESAEREAEAFRKDFEVICLFDRSEGYRIGLQKRGK